LQALILAGGEGTRLRPLTLTIPKPVVPLGDRPFIAYMIEWLRGHGVDDVILACGFMADGIKAVLGDGAQLGVRLRYVEEQEPLGTGGALKYAQDLLGERFLMLNGDVLTDIDLSGQLAQHERTGARATLALVSVEDPSAYGLVRCEPGGVVTDFLEKPGPGEADTNLINAGAYVLERDVLAEMAPAGTNISIERDVFPRLVGRGLFGFAADGYWLDIGTPQRYLQAAFDILCGRVATAVPVQSDGVLVLDGCSIAPGATIGPEAVLGPEVTVEADAVIEHSVVLTGATVGVASTIRSTIVGPRAHIGGGCQVEDGVLGEGAVVGPGSTLGAGARIFPGVVLPAGAREG
jgi:mannose-1-phosphate guanylyltransferase